MLGAFALSRTQDFNPLALNAFTAGAIALLLASLLWIGRRPET
jgi:hypothetical protein